MVRCICEDTQGISIDDYEAMDSMERRKELKYIIVVLPSCSTSCFGVTTKNVSRTEYGEK